MIKHVIVWQNGMVMVFDEWGQQIPEYQGRWEDKRDVIERDKPADVQIEHQNWPVARR